MPDPMTGFYEGPPRAERVEVITSLETRTRRRAPWPAGHTAKGAGAVTTRRAGPHSADEALSRGPRDWSFRMIPLMRAVIIPALALLSVASASAEQVHVYDLPQGARPHDVAPAPDGKVWYTAQRNGKLGILDPATGVARERREIRSAASMFFNTATPATRSIRMRKQLFKVRTS